MKKAELIKKILEQLQKELEVISLSAKAAHAAATHEESKAEDAHDTRGLEASYLANAQAGRAHDIQKTIMAFRQMELRDYGPLDLISTGAVVELEQDKTRTHYFILPFGGGLSLAVEDRTIHVITPQSPLGEELLGRKVGSEFELEARNGVRCYRIAAIS